MTDAPKKLVLEIISHSGDGSILHRTIEQFPVTLGRGYQNDIILPDPHISAQHLRIDFDGTSWWVRDLDSQNGLMVDGKPLKNNAAPLSSGHTLRAGRTEIRVFDQAHPVADAVVLQKTNKLFQWLSRGRNVWLSFVLSLCVIASWAYLEVWEYRIAPTIAWYVGIGFCMILFWSGLWGLAGRLIKHKTYFQAHVALVSLYLTGSAASWYVETYLNFLTSENLFSVIVSYLMNLTLFALLLYGTLSLATEMLKKRRIQAAAFFSGGVAISVFAIGILTQADFLPEPGYSMTLEPYLSGLAPADTLDEFTKGNEALFASEEFNAKKSALDTE